MFTHFARADEADTTSTKNQLEAFNQLISELSAKNQKPPIIHASNSAGVFNHPNANFNLVRLGIALYGLQPSKDWQLPQAMQPALTWKTVISQVKTLPPQRGVSYGHIYYTRGYEKIGTIAVGYGDGFRRKDGNQVLIRGKRAPIVGRVCMDQTMVNLDGIPDANEGDEVVLIGQQGDATITAEEVADAWETINYEVVCGIGQRIPRIYK
jgi:alanine racemase